MFSKRKKDSGRGRVQIGTTSLLLIFTVLCLVVFTVLSLASAQADSKLAKKNAEHVTAYYSADSEAEEMVRTVNETVIDAALRSQEKSGFDAILVQEFKTAYDPLTSLLTYQLDIDMDQLLIVSLKILPYEQVQTSQKNYNIESWIVQNKVDYEVDENMPVWNGDF